MELKEKLIEAMNLVFVRESTYNFIYQNSNAVYIFHKTTGQVKIKPKEIPGGSQDLNLRQAHKRIELIKRTSHSKESDQKIIGTNTFGLK